MSVGPHNERQATIWEALEPYLEHEIDLDLNVPEQAEKFSAMVAAVDSNLPPEPAYEYAIWSPKDGYIQIESPYGSREMLEAMLPVIQKTTPKARLVRRALPSWETVS